jgi:cytidylate kinase
MRREAEEKVSLPKQGQVIAIDGPAGTGKSSATRRLADALAFVHIDTGSLYRAVALLSMQKAGQDSDYVPLAAEISRTAHFEFRRMPKRNPSNRLFANGKDITEYIRTPEVSMAASKVSAVPEVRLALLGLQRRLGCEGSSILEGRDIGTVVFPDADLKFFLTASIEERAKRRLVELEATGGDAPSFEEVKSQIAERDHADSSRKVAPLRKADDALELDTSSLTLDEVVQKMEAMARKRLGISTKPPKGAK